MIRIRRATEEDVPQLLELEKVFPSDRMDRDQLRYLLTRANSTALVLEEDGARILGGAVLLWRRNAGNGRLYSIVVDPRRQGEGLGGKLLAEAEAAAVRRGLTRMSLEVRTDNTGGVAFYERHGYRVTKALPGYYEDGGAGVRMARALVTPGSGRIRLDVPYHAQSQEFTCGPACLMMAMKREDPDLALTRTLELILWKEATLVFMTSGLGGCGPMGLAVAARRRGFEVEVILSDHRTPFLSTVRTRAKKDVITLMHRALRREAVARGVKVDAFNFGFRSLAQAMRRGMVPIVLISTFRQHRVRAPHWVVVTGFDGEHVSFHDPYEAFYVNDVRRGRNVMVPVAEFDRMAAYGKRLTRSAVLIGPRLAVEAQERMEREFRRAERAQAELERGPRKRS